MVGYADGGAIVLLSCKKVVSGLKVLATQQSRAVQNSNTC
jgi:hypothetical protein